MRGGQFLTPVGIWNVDHGSPAYIPAQRPLAIVSGLFPERQTGLEFHGRWNVSNVQTLGYHLTLSNGTGPISEHKDLDRNKAVGARLYWEYFGKLYVRAGISGYYGRETVTTPSARISADTIDLTDKIGVQYDSLMLAADVLIRLGGLRLQAEWLTQQRRYTEAGRTTHAVIGGPVSTGASADSLSWAGLRTRGLPLRRPVWPDPVRDRPGGGAAAAQQLAAGLALQDDRLHHGLNVSPIESVVFKVEYVHLKHPVAPSFLRGGGQCAAFKLRGRSDVARVRHGVARSRR